MCRVRPVGEEVERREFVSCPGGLPRASVALGHGLCLWDAPMLSPAPIPTRCEKERLTAAIDDWLGRVLEKHVCGRRLSRAAGCS